MAKRRRRLFGAAESAEVWDRWQRGEGLKLIGRVFDRSSGAILQHLKPHGGIRPVPRSTGRSIAAVDFALAPLPSLDERQRTGDLWKGLSRPAARAGAPVH
jgi:hypothetical protein